MQDHDPRRVVENVREQLARHDKPIAFLFGAGASYAVNIATDAAARYKEVVSWECVIKYSKGRKADYFA